MNPPRPNRPDPALFQQSRNPPIPKPNALGNPMMYNPNQYNPGYPPSNGSWGPPRQQAPQQQQQAPPANPEPWDWDENVNNFQNYSEASQLPPSAAKLHNVPPTNTPPMYQAPDFAVNQPVSGYPPEHSVNNNQYDMQTQSSNQNWGWGEGDWEWGSENQQHSTQQQHQVSQPPVLPGQFESQPAPYQSMPPAPVSGLEMGFSTLSLTKQGREEIPPQSLERPTWSQPQPPAAPTQQEDLNSSTWSRVPTWGSALDYEQNSYEPELEQSYPRELGERNTFADGASFTDPSQPVLPPPTLGNGQAYPPPVPPISEQQQQQQPVNPYRSVPPPPTAVASEITRISPIPQVVANTDQTDAELQAAPVDIGAAPVYPVAPSPSLSARINPGQPYGLPEGFNNGPGVAAYSGPEFSATAPVGMPVSDAPIGNRLPGSGSRSQSGTPSMERESERPDAEGGYENDQPTPLQPTPLFSQTSAGSGFGDRKVAQESPAGSRPSSRQAGSTPSSENPSTNPSPYHMAGDATTFVRPKPVSTTPNYYPTSTTAPTPPAPPTAPTTARGSQEAVGSEFGPPVSTVPLSRADGATTTSMLPPSSQRMIPGSGSQGPPLLSMVPQQPQPPPQSRPAGTVTPVSEQRIVTGFAKNDPVPAPPVSASTPLLATVPQAQPQQAEEVRSQTRSPPPPHRSETIGSENPRASAIVPTTVATGNVSTDRSDERISSDRDREREREIKPHDRSRVERDRDDYDRSHYPEDDEDERFSTSYRERDRRYDGDRNRDRERRDSRRYDDRDRGYSRQDYDDDRRSGYGPSDQDRVRDPRRRDSRRSDYYLTEAEMYERSGGRRSSLYEGENNDPAGDFNRSAYGFNTSRDGRRRDTDRSRIDDRYYPGTRDRPGAEPERAHSERDYRPSGRRRDPRDVYYQDARYYGYSRDAAYDPYRASGYPSAAAAAAAYSQYYSQQLTYNYKFNYPLFEQMRLKDPVAYNEWYQRNYAQRYTPTVVTGGTGTALGSIATSEVDRASVHSGRSSVNEDHPSMMANHSIAHQLRGSTTGLDQSHAYDYSVYQDENPVMAAAARPVQDMTPHKFPCPHVIGRFSPGGMLVRVLPNSPKDGVAAHIELHDLNVILGELPTAKEMKFFPGPLVPGQTHKQQVAVFCQQKIRKASDDSHQLVDRQSYILLWELLLLLLRQNGTIVGTDIAELLLKDHEILKEPVEQETPEPTDVGATVADRTLVSRHTEASVTRKFRELLLFGNKKEALEWAMTQGLWGHALFLASKMDQRTYSSVMIRFANGLALTDPLQTLYQLMSGRQPTAVTSCGDDKWGDWRPHLSMILSNSTSKSGTSSDLDKKSIVTLGDTLSARGFLLAAHFCYLVAQVEFGSYSNKASKLVLLSSSTSQPFDTFASNEAIQCTEIYEYARQLAQPDFMIPSFQPYKFLYATRLAEHGRAAEALQYCEAVGNILARSASAYPASLMDQVYQLGSMLKYSDPQFLAESNDGSATDPAWLTALDAALKAASQQADSPDNNLAFNQPSEPESLPPVDYSHQQQQQQYGDQQQQQQNAQQQQPYYQQQPPSIQQQPYYDPGQQQQQPYVDDSNVQQQQQLGDSYSSNTGQDYGSYNSQYNQNYNWQQPQQQQQQQQWSAANGAGTDYWNQSNNNLNATTPVEDSTAAAPGYPDPSYYKSSLNSAGPSSLETKHYDDNKPDSNKQQQQDSSKAAAKAQQTESGSWFGGFFSKLKPKNQMKLPDDKDPSIIWDPVKKKWVDKTKDGEEEAAPLAPPPKMPLGPASPAPASLTANNNNNNNEGNRFGLNKGRGRLASNYVKPSNMPISSSNSPLPMLNTFPAATTPSTIATPSFFVPSPIPADASAPTDFVSSPAPEAAAAAASGGDSGERFMYNPTQLAPPTVTSRPSLASRAGRYPRT